MGAWTGFDGGLLILEGRGGGALEEGEGLFTLDLMFSLSFFVSSLGIVVAEGGC